MKRNKGLTLIEIIIAMALLGIIFIAFLTALSSTYTFLSNTKNITQDVFEAQKTLEVEIEDIKHDLAENITPPNSSTYTLFAGSFGGVHSKTVTGYLRDSTIINTKKLTTVVGEVRMPAYSAPIAQSTNLFIRLNGTAITDNHDYATKADLTLRATSVVNDPDSVFLLNKHEWYVSRAGYNIPMVSPASLDEDFDLGRLYPLYPNDYLPIPIKSNSDMLSQSDLNTILETYAGRHIIYTITPFADTGKKGATIFSSPIFLSGPTVINGLYMHLDSNIISKEDLSSIVESGSILYAKVWNDLSGNGNSLSQSTQNSRPILNEVQYQDDVYVWGKSLSENIGTTSMSRSSFSPSAQSEFSVVLVAKVIGINTDTSIISTGGSDPWSIGINGDGNMSFSAGGTNAELEDALGLDGQWHIFTCIASSGDLKIRVDGVDGTEGTTSGSRTFSPFTVNWNDTDVAEVLVYDQDISANSDMTKIETFLMNKYNPDPSIITVNIVLLKPIPATTIGKNQPFTMPTTVQALMSNGTTQNVAVTWSNTIDTSIVGTQTSLGTAVLDSSKTVLLTVNVVAIDHFLPLTAITVEKAQPYPLPAVLPAVLTNGDTFNVQVTWSGTVEVLEIGGPYTLSATSVLDTDKTVDLSVTVIAVSVKGISLDQTSVELHRDETVDLVATVIPVDAQDKTVIWTSSDPAIASVNSTGTVVALIPGTAAITATTVDGGHTATCDVTVLATPVASVSLNKSATTINIGNSETLTATVLPANADNTAVSWSSSNPTVATVINGVITTNNTGSAVITVTTVDGGHTATCDVTVVRPVTGINLTPSSISVDAGATNNTLVASIIPVNATNTTVIWSSNNTAVATVNSSGVVTGVSRGAATISARAQDGGYTKTCAVTVVQRVTGVTVSPTSLTLNVGETQTLTENVLPSDANNKAVTWSSNNTAVATVSSTGVVTAVSLGNATITVITQDNGRTATCAVQIVPTPVDVTMHWIAGSYANEAGWQVIDTSNNSVVYCVLTGPYTQSNTPTAYSFTITLSLTSGRTYEVRGYDHWGDGWNGGRLLFRIEGSTIFQTYGPPNTGYNPSPNQCTGVPYPVTAPGAAILGTFTIP